jgi:hypothetical protein
MKDWEAAKSNAFSLLSKQVLCICDIKTEIQVDSNILRGEERRSLQALPGYSAIALV